MIKVGDQVEHLSIPYIKGRVDKIDGHLVFIKGEDQVGCVGIVTSDRSVRVVSDNKDQSLFFGEQLEFFSEK